MQAYLYSNKWSMNLKKLAEYTKTTLIPADAKKYLKHVVWLHQSDCIASTVGWIKDVSQTLEYGKDYEGYWNGELFVKQVILHIKFLIINLLIWRSLIYSSKRNLF